MNRRCRSRGLFYDGRKRCEFYLGHAGWHQATLPSGTQFSWDAKGGWKIDSRASRPQDERAT